MASATTQQYEITAPPQQESYGRPLIIVSVLFFTLGFLVCVHDILIPHLHSIFILSARTVLLVQSAFFWIPVFSIPAARVVDRIGYQKTMVGGLLTMALGAFFFLPAATEESAVLFFVGLSLLACGIIALQVATNAYVAVLGPQPTAASRLSLVHAFKSLGTVIAPSFGGMLVLSATPVNQIELNNLSQDALHYYRLAQAAAVKLPYVLIGITLLALAAIFGSSRIPDFAYSHRRSSRGDSSSLWKHPNLVMATVAVFACVGAEVSIIANLPGYFSWLKVGKPLGLTLSELVALFGVGLLAGRFLGAGLLQRVGTRLLLAVSSLIAALLALASLESSGHVAMWTMLAAGFFTAILFPCVFALGIADLGPLTSDGSGLLMTATVGGAVVPLLQDALARRIGLHHSFVLPVACFVLVAIFAAVCRKRRMRYSET